MISLHNMLPFELTKDTPYLALSGELWSVFYEYINRYWSCYKGFLLYSTFAAGVKAPLVLTVPIFPAFYCVFDAGWSYQIWIEFKANVHLTLLLLYEYNMDLMSYHVRTL